MQRSSLQEALFTKLTGREIANAKHKSRNLLYPQFEIKDALEAATAGSLQPSMSYSPVVLRDGIPQMILFALMAFITGGSAIANYNTMPPVLSAVWVVLVALFAWAFVYRFKKGRIVIDAQQISLGGKIYAWRDVAAVFVVRRAYGKNITRVLVLGMKDQELVYYAYLGGGIAGRFTQRLSAYIRLFYAAHSV